MFLLAFSVQAQREVTKFLGIPVDGTKPAMIKKLEAKGLKVINRDKGHLMDEFNGEQSAIGIITQRNKVWRIVVSDITSRSESQIVLRFNELCRQFGNNPRYVGPVDEQMIDEDEDISYEITVHDKQYQAAFFQKDSAGTVDENRSVWFCINKSPFNPSEYIISIYYDNLYNEAQGEDL